MDIALPPDDPLRALFTGKREWIRVPSSHAVTVQGEGGPYTGRVLELSRGGICLILEDDRFYETGVDGFAFVIQRFPDGADVRFTEHDLARHVRIIRITLHDNRWLALGCQFEEPISPGEAVRLGVAAQEVDRPEATRRGLGWGSRRTRPVSVLLQALRSGIVGPYAVAPVIAAGDEALDLVVPGTAEQVADELARDGLTGAVMLGRRCLWSGGLRLVACEAMPMNGSGPHVRVRVIAGTTLGARVHRELHVDRRATD